MTTTTTTFQEAVAHRDAMLDVFTEITQDCVLLGLTPTSVMVNRWSSGSLSIDVQFGGKDTAAVDALADSYGNLPDRDCGDSNYGRGGAFDIDGRRVDVTVYSGRPKPVTPTFPAGYAPQAVDEGPITEPGAGCSCGARGDLDFILEHVCPLEAEQCPTCHGSGGWQQHDGAIEECPRGCSTGGAA